MSYFDVYIIFTRSFFCKTKRYVFMLKFLKNNGKITNYYRSFYPWKHYVNRFFKSLLNLKYVPTRQLTFHMESTMFKSHNFMKSRWQKMCFIQTVVKPTYLHPRFFPPKNTKKERKNDTQKLASPTVKTYIYPACIHLWLYRCLKWPFTLALVGDKLCLTYSSYNPIITIMSHKYKTGATSQSVDNAEKPRWPKTFFLRSNKIVRHSTAETTSCYMYIHRVPPSPLLAPYNSSVYLLSHVNKT